MMSKMILSDVVIDAPAKLRLNNDNAAEVVKQGLESLPTDQFFEILCNKLVEIKVFDSETYATLKKLYNNDYSKIAAIMFMHK